MVEEVQVREPARAEFFGHAAHAFLVVGGGGQVVCASHRREPHADARGPEDRRVRVDDLEQEPHAVLDRVETDAAPRVVARVEASREELVDEIRVGGVHLDAVESGGLGATRRVGVVGDDARQFVRLKRTRHACLDTLAAAIRVAHADIALRLHRHARDRRLAVGLVRDMAHAADMPKLEKDAPARRVHAVGDELPASDLLVGVDARSVRIALAFRRDLRGFADEKPEGCPLRIVLGLEFARNVARRLRALAGERRHEDAVRAVEVAQADRVEQVWHGRAGFVSEAARMQRARCGRT